MNSTVRIVEVSKCFNKIFFKDDYQEQFRTIALLQKGRKKFDLDKYNKVQIKQCYKALISLNSSIYNFYAYKKVTLL